MSFVCHHCGQWHPGPPMGFDLVAPEHWSDDLAADPNSILEDEVCVIPGVGYFIHALLEIPVIDHHETYLWTAWVSLSKDNFYRAVELWEQPGRESEPPYFGWLSSQIPGYQVSTLNLKTSLRTGPPGERPTIELEPTNHPLAVDQRHGITLARVEQITSALLHPCPTRSPAILGD